MRGKEDGGMKREGRGNRGPRGKKIKGEGKTKARERRENKMEEIRVEREDRGKEMKGRKV